MVRLLRTKVERFTTFIFSLNGNFFLPHFEKQFQFCQENSSATITYINVIGVHLRKLSGLEFIRRLCVKGKPLLQERSEQ